MKKIVRNVFALLLALTFILSLAACGGNSASSGAAPAASGSAAKLSASQIEALSQSLLQQLRG